LNTFSFYDIIPSTLLFVLRCYFFSNFICMSAVRKRSMQAFRSKRTGLELMYKKKVVITWWFSSRLYWWHCHHTSWHCNHWSEIG